MVTGDDHSRSNPKEKSEEYKVRKTGAKSTSFTRSAGVCTRKEKILVSNGNASSRCDMGMLETVHTFDSVKESADFYVHEFPAKVLLSSGQIVSDTVKHRTWQITFYIWRATMEASNPIRML